MKNMYGGSYSYEDRMEGENGEMNGIEGGSHHCRYVRACLDMAE